VIGETVSRYRIEAELGSGGMGVVYRAHDLNLGREVALKFLPERLAADPAVLARFEREARLASSLNHQSICIVHDIDQHEGRPFIVMELLRGETVKRRLLRGPVPVAQAVELVLQAAGALDAAHRRGIVHRDIKPANLFVSAGGQLKVLDFGLAKLSETSLSAPARAESDSLPPAALDDLTRPGTAIGTVAYMSPEQALGQAVDARSDLFSLGAVLHEMLTGERAFPGATPGAVFDRILNREPKPASRLMPEVPEVLQAVLDRLLAKQPERRYPSAAEVVADLEQVARLLAAQESGTLLASTRRIRAWSRSRSALVVGALGLVAALVLVGHRILAQPKRLSSTDPILLAGFENQTGEAVFDATLEQALAVQLGQSPFLNIVADDAVSETLTLMGRPGDERLTPAVAREVCQRLSTRAMVRGSISRLGELYVLLLEASECESGAALAREQGEARSAEQVLATLGTMASRLRSRVGESLRSVRAFDVPVAQATTPSLEALRVYTLALDQRRRGAEVEAIPLLERALELDPAFAAAATTLSTVYGNLGEAGRSIEYARLAYAQRDKVSQRERLFITYQYHDRVTGDLAQTADVLEVWKRTFPNDFRPPNALAIVHNRLGRYQQGVAEAEEALRRTPGHPFAVSQLAHAYRGLGRYEDARRVAEQALARGVGTVPTRRLVYQLAVLRGDELAANGVLEWARGTPREFDIVAAHAQVLAHGGRLRRAHEQYQRSVALAEQRSLAETGLQYVAHDALTHALYGRREQALALARAALHPRKDGRAPSDAVPRVRLLTTLSLLGAPEAVRLTDALVAQMPSSTLVQTVVLPCTRAAAALAAGRPRDAVEALQPAAAYEAGAVAVLIPRYLRGLAYLADRQPARARDEFEAIAADRGTDPFSPVVTLAPLGRARALAALGEREAAAAAYRELREAWRDADPDLPPLLAARAEQEQLAVR
jgi:serine/threonine protein kinase/tetratricopeptide (TPR) repeat protein